MKKAKEITTEEFDSILADVVKENASSLLSIPGVYEILSEHFNNEVLERFEEENKAAIPCKLCRGNEKNQCGEKSSKKLICTRKKGHKGRHAACGGINSIMAHPYQRWS